LLEGFGANPSAFGHYLVHSADIVGVGAMPRSKKAGLDEMRAFFAKMMAVASGSTDPRFERAFELIRREAFLPPGPWKIFIYTNQRYVETPSADPIYLYQSLLVALDASRGINNGEPLHHASWMGAVEPKAGEVVCHIGAGTGYYTAILSVLTLPGGEVHAFEIDEGFAERARASLSAFGGVTVTAADATKLPLPSCDLIYVNAGVVAPPLSWLNALRPQGRMIFPWRPAESVALALVITRASAGFAVKPLMPSWFIPCVGASSADQCLKAPALHEAWTVRSLWLASERQPDETAVAICEQVWFSSAELPRA
jgi:protein-L-isoaspartate(D-aspartate) O-methyltransferase